MVDWTTSMQQTYEYYIVDPITWANKSIIRDIEKTTIDRDETNSTLGGATIDCTNSIPEAYVRIYLITIQNGVTEKHVLGTFMVQTPSTSFDGKKTSISMDAYTPLIELKEKKMPLGYSLYKNQRIMDAAFAICRDNVRAPVIQAKDDQTLALDFVADISEDQLSYLTDLIACANFKFDIDEMGRILYAPKQDISSLQPVWTYSDDNSSILYPSITIDRDLYGIPNVVEVIYSKGSGYYYSRVVNNDVNSPISTVNRGREIVQRITDVNLPGTPTQQQINDYATQTLRNLSSLEYTITYSHGYCPVRVGDCVRLNYKKANINNIKAKVTRQSIDCTPGCKVEETAVFTTNLWG